ncbi:MAG TPA: phage holin family protein [Pyrinomonadaceae bacterium]|nr:phage holin family protein [Pyrinomonadaceae bacterium]
MADLEKRTTATAPARDAIEPQTEIEGLPALFGRLSDGVTTLLDTKLSLLKVEIKEDVAGYISGAVKILIGGIIAAVGFAILNVAVALFIGSLLPETMDPALRIALGFAITGALYLLIGGIFIITAKNRLAKQDMVPNRSVSELRKDKEWLKKEL